VSLYLEYPFVRCDVNINETLGKGSSVSIVTGIRTGRPRFYFRQGRETDFFLPYRVQTVSGTQPAPSLKGMGREANHTPPSSTEFKNAWNYTSATSYVFMT